ncbi:hypothetical protein KC19_VG273900 [Ceratodon purpureus]|uniref:Uncharacterized protein n=1 Tax=Ceratodon purpureus TaxID=3225 RepID=A0A8T0HUD8_CERPU|nr:hypothetical protein KC19_VG273900 [Ceratodon purpureus]
MREVSPRVVRVTMSSSVSPLANSLARQNNPSRTMGVSLSDDSDDTVLHVFHNFRDVGQNSGVQDMDEDDNQPSTEIAPNVATQATIGAATTNIMDCPITATTNQTHQGRAGAGYVITYVSVSPPPTRTAAVVELDVTTPRDMAIVSPPNNNNNGEDVMETHSTEHCSTEVQVGSDVDSIVAELRLGFRPPASEDDFCRCDDVNRESGGVTGVHGEGTSGI